jgi:UDP-N-acetylmuramoyl-tripeptide--D-alanyl-D-alanine ligase
MNSSIEQIIKATRGKLLQEGKNVFSGVSTDSRSIKSGELFVPLSGEHFDGHDFIEQAVKSGAAGALVEEGKDIHQPGFTLIEVADTLRALQDIAHFVRMSRPELPVIGITGTNGKTTTKEMLASILARRGPVLKNEGNLNNHIGVPLTLLELKEEHWIAVIEMGMSAPGEIDRLAKIAAPQTGVITNVGPAHLDVLRDLAGVAKAKGELIAALPPEGTAVLNADDPYLKTAASEFKGKTLSFGLGRDAQVFATEIEEKQKGMSFRLKAPGATVLIKLNFIGSHNIYNALAAAAAALSLGMTAEEIRGGLEECRPAKMRMQEEMIDGVRVINDTYNANPASMAAAISALAAMKGGRKFAILGEMLELGSTASRSHFDTGRLAGASGVYMLVLVGEHAPDAAQGAVEAGMPEENIFIAAGPEKAASIAAEFLKPGDVALVKGSRGSRMELAVERLKAGRIRV